MTLPHRLLLVDRLLSKPQPLARLAEEISALLA